MHIENDEDFGEVDMNRYEKQGKKGEGTYGEVYKAYDQRDKKYVALKKMHLKIGQEGIPSTVMREISLLQEVKHPNIVNLEKISIDKETIHLVFEYVEGDLGQLIASNEAQSWDENTIKKILYQILLGVQACHQKRILHRDIKPQNILISSDHHVKLADFGLSRTYSIPIRPYTHEVVTLWYRAPEILLGATEYCTPVDIWSIGAIFAEMVIKEPLFMGKSEIEQLLKIFKILGTPNDDIWQNVSQLQFYSVKFCKYPKLPISQVEPRLGQKLSELGLDLLERMLTYDPCHRITAIQALKHPYFDGLFNNQ